MRSSVTVRGGCLLRRWPPRSPPISSSSPIRLGDNGHRLVLRNAYYRERQVVTAAGAVAVRAPGYHDTRIDPDTGERQRFLRRSCRRGRAIPAGGRGVAAVRHNRHPDERVVDGKRPVHISLPTRCYLCRAMRSVAGEHPLVWFEKLLSCQKNDVIFSRTLS